MKQMIAGLSGLLCLAGVLVAGGAQADIPRLDNHCPTLGAACNNAGFSSEDKGICKATQDPQCGIGGGGNVDSCELCEAPSSAGGAAGAGGTAGAAGTAGDGAAYAGGAAGDGDTVETAGARNTAGAQNAAGSANHAGASNGAAGETSSTDSPGQSDDSGCSVRAVGSERGVAALLLGLGLAALAISRRRR